MRPLLHSADRVFSSNWKHIYHPIHTEKLLHTNKSNIPQTATVTDNPKQLCQVFVAELLHGALECCVCIEDNNELVILFDERRFIDTKVSLGSVSPDKCGSKYLLPSDSYPFVSLFLRSQCFSNYITSTCLKMVTSDIKTNLKNDV